MPGRRVNVAEGLPTRVQFNQYVGWEGVCGLVTNCAVLRFGPLFSVDHGSFPSGHAVSAGTLLVAVAAVLPPSKRLAWWIVGGLIALGMVWQRTLINAHWFSDAVFGVIGGASATLVLWWAFSTLLEKDYAKPLFRRRIESPAHEGAS